MLLLLLALGCLAGAAYFLGELATLPARERADSVRRAATYGRFRVRAGLERESLARPRARAAVAVARRPGAPAQPAHDLGRRRAEAPRPPGSAQKSRRPAFLAAKGIFALAAAGLALVLHRLRRQRPGCCSALFLVLVGFFGPDYLVTIYARRRRERIRAALPDALDLLAVSVEAGLGLRRRDREADRAHGGPAGRRVRADARRRCGSARAAARR